MAGRISWHLLPSFLGVVREGSLSGAARRLKLAQPTVGRHIAELEASLGAALFTRSPSGLDLTPAGEALVPYVETMEVAAGSLLRTATSAAATEGPSVAGTVRITATEVVTTEVLPPILAEIRDDYPLIVFELVPTSRAQDLLRRDSDIAVRMARPKQSAVLAKKVGDLQLGLFAHRRYIERHGQPAEVRQLTDYHLVGFDEDDHSVRSVAEGQLPFDREIFSVRTDNNVTRAAAVRAGLGIGVMHVGLAARDGDLVRVLPDALNLQLQVWLAMHEDQRSDVVVRTVFGQLSDRLVAWLDGQPSP